MANAILQFPPTGRLHSVAGLQCVIDGVPGALGDLVTIQHPPAPPIPAEIVGFRGRQAIVMPLASLDAIPSQALVLGTGRPLTIPTGSSTLGRLLSGTGAALDGGWPVYGPRTPITTTPLSILDRGAITTPFWTGVSLIDTCITLGRGQRVGIFAGAGVGKTTLLQQILADAQYDVAIVALIGERGREAAEFWERLPTTARTRMTTLVATSDQPPLVRLRTLDVANRLAETWRMQGAHVLLLVDSMTRVAHAAREVGLTTGEAPTARGYPPSFFATLPRWFERAGVFRQGSITALYTILLDADDPSEPVADAVQGLLDGGIYLDRARAERHQFPAINPVRSLSRLQPELIPDAAWALTGQLRQALVQADDAKDLVAVGAYHAGNDPNLDRALAAVPVIDAWARQAVTDHRSWEDSWTRLLEAVMPYWPEEVAAIRALDWLPQTARIA